MNVWIGHTWSIGSNFQETPLQSPTIAESESIPKITILSNFPPPRGKRLNCEIYDTPPILPVLCGFCTCLWFGTVGRDHTHWSVRIFMWGTFLWDHSLRSEDIVLGCSVITPPHTHRDLTSFSLRNIQLIESAKIDEIDGASLGLTKLLCDEFSIVSVLKVCIGLQFM